MHLGQDNPGYTYNLGDEKLECSTMERDLGVWADSLTCINSVPWQPKGPASNAL